MKKIIRNQLFIIFLAVFPGLSFANVYETYFRDSPDDFIVEPKDYALTVEYDKEKNDLKMKIRSYFISDIRELKINGKKIKYMDKPVMICKAKVRASFTDSSDIFKWRGDVEFKSVLVFHGVDNIFYTKSDKFNDPSMRFYEFDQIVEECRHIPNFLNHSNFSALLRTNTDQVQSFLSVEQPKAHSALVLNRGATYGQNVAVNPKLKKMRIGRPNLGKLSTIEIAWDCETMLNNGMLDNVLFKSKCSDDLSFLGDVTSFSNGMSYEKIYKEDSVISRGKKPGDAKEINTIFVYKLAISNFLNNEVNFDWMLNLKRLKGIHVNESSLSLNLSRQKIKSFLSSRVKSKDDYLLPGVWHMNIPNVVTRSLGVSAINSTLVGNKITGKKKETTHYVWENGRRVEKKSSVVTLDLNFDYLPKHNLMMISGNILPSRITCNNDYHKFPENIKFSLNKKSSIVIGPDSQLSKEAIQEYCNEIDAILKG